MPRLRVAALALLAGSLPAAGPAEPSRQLTFEQRVAAQRAIERVYYSHQEGATRSFDEAVPREVLEEKVRTYLKQSVALDKFWRTPVTAEALRRELERMEANTLYPDRLEEIYEALDNDSFLIQETLVRASLAGRLARNFFASDERIHGAARAEAERLRGMLESGELPLEREDRHRTITEYSRARVGRALRTSTDMGSLQGSRPLQLELEAEQYERERALAPERVGEVGPMTEEPGAFVIRTVQEESASSFRVATYNVERPSWERWWQTSRPSAAESEVRPVALRLAGKGGPILSVHRGRGGTDPVSTVPIPSVSCAAEGVWDNGILDDNPRPRLGHAMVWTGREVIVWGGSGGATGDRYDPITDTWAPVSVVGAPGGGSPAYRNDTAIWTGREMVVWDGEQGGAYDPVSDRWRPISTTAAPRSGPGVWTGHEMIVWDGARGGRYDPAGDFWKPISTEGAPRNQGSSMVWTGSEMILWGGYECDYDCYAVTSGARYNPGTDAWTSTSWVNAPQRRWGHSAIWTGSSMVIWGGLIFDGEEATDTGGIYDPASDTWTSTSPSGVPAPRWGHVAVWTGREMLVWGGSFGGGGEPAARFDPAANAWFPISNANAPKARSWPTAVWTGALMVVWGGGWNDNSGGRYDPEADAWTATFRTPGVPPYGSSGMFWTGSDLITWGWRFGWAARYNPITDSWMHVSTTGAPDPLGHEVAFWTGDSMVVWDGIARKGARYDPTSDSWKNISSGGSPSSRSGSASVWTGAHLLVWGGTAGAGEVKTGARYDPSADTWAPISTQGAPSPRRNATAIWTGEEVIIWGGLNSAQAWIYEETGRRYDPRTDTWGGVSVVGAPSGRYLHSAVWTGAEMVVWGGRTSQSWGVSTGGRYDPATDRWRPTTLAGSPSPRYGQSAFWTGAEMIVWGPAIGGGRYDPLADSWAAVAEAPTGGLAVWTGTAMIAWDGTRGGRYFPRGDPDSDGDGVSACEGDCNDTDPLVAPGAAELPGNILDEDCDGARACDPRVRWPSRGAFVSCVSAQCQALESGGRVDRARCREASTEARRVGFCGDGVRSATEVCDGTDLGGLTCERRGFGGGTLACEPTCDSFDESGCTAFCGDGVIRPPEICDGVNLDGETCLSQGLQGEILACNDRCDGFDVSGCIWCGNGRREVDDDEYWYDEACDGADLAGATCSTLRFDGGTVRCDENCEFDTSECTTICGDGVRRGDEACDGQVWVGCDRFGFYRGAVACNSDCTWDTSGCEGRCGDGRREGLEQCDGADYGASTCVSFGFDAGALGCTSRCTIEVSGCTTICGDGVRRGSEACDGPDLGGRNCASFGAYGGAPSCNSDCTWNLSGCDGRCGDGIREGPEQCDGADIPATCQTSGYDGGSIACGSRCAIDLTDCTTVCGDRVRRGTEECDGGDVGGRTCESFRLYGGRPACNSNCTWDLSDCDGRCGDGVREGEEQCDGADVNGLSCEMYGFEAGSIRCTTSCTQDLGDCGFACGNGVRGGAEVCDGRDLQTTCAGIGFSSGVLACTASCDGYDTIGCCCWDGRAGCPPCPTCGNGIREAPFEACDRLDIGGQTCESQGRGPGTLVCNSRCDGFFLGGCLPPDP